MKYERKNNMKNKMIMILVALALVLSACSTATTAASSSTSTSTNSVSTQTEFMVGILKLENTDQAVNAKQASELLPLWEVIKVLAKSSTSSPAEMQAAFRQVKETLTASQLQAIADMKLTSQDITAFEQTLNTTSVQSSSKTSSSSSQGGFGGPGGPGEDSVGGLLNGFSQQTSTTSSSSSKTSSGTANQIPTDLLNALIKLAQDRANT
jgi:predicted component of type VI protein secretion system